MTAQERLEQCYTSVRERLPFRPKVGLILGSGLGDLAEKLEIVASIPYSEIANFPISTVAGHKGRFVFAYIGEVATVIMQGRVHYCEGYSMEEVVLPTRLMHLMGAETLFLTNAAGGINSEFAVGDFMLITDQISSFVPSPLIGPNADKLGERFPDMSQIYDLELQNLISKTAQNKGIRLQKGVYLQTSGPNFESPAEVRMYSMLGADAVGMSTACEALAANHMKMRICGVSCISNLATGISKVPLSDDDVKEIANKVGAQFQELVLSVIRQMA